VSVRFACRLVLISALFVGCGPTIVPPTATPTAAPTASDGTIDRAALAHDSRETLYRTPGGAVPPGRPAMLRFRTLHDDVTNVTARVYSVNAGDDQELAMEKVATGVSSLRRRARRANLRLLADDARQ